MDSVIAIYRTADTSKIKNLAPHVNWLMRMDDFNPEDTKALECPNCMFGALYYVKYETKPYICPWCGTLLKEV